MDTPLKTILLIEDDKSYSDVVQQLHACVSRAFYDECKLVVVPSWESGMESIEANRPDAVVLDLTLLPNMTEEQTLAVLYARWQVLPPVVVLTGNEDPAMRRKAILSGAEAVCFKHDFNRHPELLCERVYEAFLRRLRDARA